MKSLENDLADQPDRGMDRNTETLIGGRKFYEGDFYRETVLKAI
jgi:hypothetical protein